MPVERRCPPGGGGIKLPDGRCRHGGAGSAGQPLEAIHHVVRHVAQLQTSSVLSVGIAVQLLAPSRGTAEPVDRSQSILCQLISNSFARVSERHERAK